MSREAIVVCVAVLAILVVPFVAILRVRPTLAILLPTVYSASTKTASVAYLEMDRTWLVETTVLTEPIGAAWRQFGYTTALFLTASWVLATRTDTHARRGMQLANDAREQSIGLALRVVLAVVSVQLVNAVISAPYALPFSGISRQEFWADLRVPQVGNLLGVLLVPAPFVIGLAIGFMAVTGTKSLQRSTAFIAALYIGYFVLIGQRFNGFLLAGMFAAIGFALSFWAAGVPLRIRRPAVFAAIASLPLLTASQAEIGERGIAAPENSGGAFEAFFYRIFALQGGVAYTAERFWSDGIRGSWRLLIEGMPTTVRFFVEEPLESIYVRDGVNLAGSLSGNALAALGPAGAVLFLCSYGVLLGVLGRAWFILIAKGEYIAAAGWSYLMLWTYSSYARGSLEPLLTPKSVLIVVAVLGYLQRPKALHRHSNFPRSLLE